MYTAFNLELEFVDLENPQYFINIGKKRINKLKWDSEDELSKFILANGTIDGTGLSDKWFKKVQSDVFISHSHNDENLAFALAGWLKDTFNLNVFMDEVIWDSADKLIHILDDKYCWQPNSETYNYTKRNLTTSHVHAMLSTAIFSVMDKSEVIIFLNTKESVPQIHNVLNEDSKYTLSPWIYEELVATKLLRVTNWIEYREQATLEHFYREDGSENLKIAYQIPLEQLTDINIDILSSWKYDYQKDSSLLQEHSKVMFRHPLNYLYNLVFRTRDI